MQFCHGNDSNPETYVIFRESLCKIYWQQSIPNDESLIHRRFGNKRPLSEEFIKHYEKKEDFFALGDAIKNRELPYAADAEASGREVTGFVLRDGGISAQKKNDPYCIGRTEKPKV